MAPVETIEVVYLFNLVVRANESLAMPMGRMLEGASPEVAKAYITSTGYDFQRLAQLPTILTGEFKDDDITAIAVLGYVDEPSNKPEISEPILRFPAVKLLDRGLLSSWGGAHTSWTVHDGDPFRMFAPHSIRPLAGPAGVKIANSLIAVMMPFNNDVSVDPVYKAIRRGSEKAGMSCKRVDEIKTPTAINEDVTKLIAESRLVIADLTGLNSNVMYEVGYAQGLGKCVIRISRDPLDRLPFDIRQHRVIAYRNSENGLNELSALVCESLHETIAMAC